MHSVFSILTIFYDDFKCDFGLSFRTSTKYNSKIGNRAAEDEAGHAAVPKFAETTRDFKSFERRTGTLPEQQVLYSTVLYSRSTK